MEVSTVFGVIFTLILISALLIFGFNFLSSIFQEQELNQISEAVDNFQATVTNFYYTTSGSPDGPSSTSTYTLQIPSSSTFCFVDPLDPSPNIGLGWDPQGFTETIIEDEGYNLWIYYQNGASEVGRTLEHTNISSGSSFCIQDGDKLKLTNLGVWVELSPKD